MITEKIKIKHSFIFPLLFLITIWIIKIYEFILADNLSNIGLYPREIKGIIGIITSPLIHGDFNHLFSNSISIFVLSAVLFYFYRPVSYKIFFYSWIFSNSLVWMFARPSYHIGCSGIIYALASFLFVSGIIRKNFRLLAITLLVTFLYGSMVWGIFPIQKGISWESHLFGFIVGIALAFIFKKYGPQDIKPSFEEDDIDENIAEVNTENDNIDNSEKARTTINYIYTKEN